MSVLIVRQDRQDRITDIESWRRVADAVEAIDQKAVAYLKYGPKWNGCSLRPRHWERFQHGIKLLQWRPEKAPRHCTFELIDETANKAPSPMRR
ncbi:hypothetical protein [Mesorhizobium captivum]|uniref:hypothetical protein n=1 Tax=Mesorhizobium captivum TaxID=3072319 RepID=UPI002A244A34|nr:hypothetical protein [Mesorhizobium sp. VK3C]MDX8450047.1 hypothetical protein [Mesorhizobium sp. VK3C]